MPITERQKSALRAFIAVERLGRPDIAKTRTSRESDKEINEFTILLLTFVAIWLLKGYFDQNEKQQLGTLFRRHAERQYFLGQDYADRATGEPKPLTRRDVDDIEKLARDAERDFMAELERKTMKEKPEEQMKTLAEQTSSDLGMRSLNRGTLSNARFVEFVTRRDSRVCFPAHTLVKTAAGDKYIKDVKAGDMILTRTGYRRCVATSKRPYRGKMNLVRAGKSLLAATCDHPVWVNGQGWKHIANLTATDILQSVEDQPVQVSANINLFVSDANNAPSLRHKIGILARILCCIMPVDAITNRALFWRSFTRSAQISRLFTLWQLINRMVFARSLDVYDIEVKDDHEFYANSILVHNCPICEDLDGDVFEVDPATGIIKNGPLIPEDLHPNCLLPETPVEAEGILAGLRSWYDGPVIELITSGGARLTITPNHMLLTDRGFAAADLLRKADKVFYRTGFNSLSVVDPDNHRKPSTIQQVVESLAEFSKMPAISVPKSTEYLHGDALFCNGNIDVIRANGLLMDTMKSTRSEHADADCFSVTGDSTNTRPFSGSGATAQLFKRVAFAADCGMSGSRQSAPFFRGRLRHTEIHGFTTITRSYSTHLESVANPPTASPDKLANCIDRFAGLIELQDIVDINIRRWTGYVYDLQTESTVYCGNGIILSNCRCRYLLLGAGEEE